MTLLEITLTVIQAQGYRGLGHKSAAALANAPLSAMRYALQAWKAGITFAILAGTIKDQRVVGILHGLPTAACQTVARVETKLNRRLDRKRAARLAELFLKYAIKRNFGECHVRRAEESIREVGCGMC